MITANLLSRWTGIVESVALIAIVVLALCLMVGIVKLRNVVRCLGAILGVTTLLIMLPAIMASLWSSMTFWQHLAIVILGGLIGVVLKGLLTPKQKSK